MPRSSAVLPFLVAVLLAAACDRTVHGNGQRVDEERSLSGFSRVDSATAVDVEIEQGDEYAVRVSIDSNVLHELRTRVSGDTLLIDSEVDPEDLVRGPHVRVTIPELRAAELSGSGGLSVLGHDSRESLALALSGSGDVVFSGAAPELTVRLSGSGLVELEGSAGTVDLRLDGSGDIDAARLLAADGRLDLSGSGSIRASLSNSAEVDLSGSGDVYVHGDAELTRVSIDGSGDLHRE